ncbi:hypothetical protein JXL19_02550 [bacterium]|nr:hypothetical protein [bacterium]
MDTSTFCGKRKQPETEEGLPYNSEQPATAVQEAAKTYPVYLAYFTQAGCKECERAYRDIKYIRSRYPLIEIMEFDIADKESKTLQRARNQTHID